MQAHLDFKNEEKGYKNKRLSQEIGIAVAKTTFNDMLNINFQGFMFSWEDTDLLERSKDNLFVHFSSTPKNLEELENIAFQAALIEFSNLKESYNKELPVRVFNDEECMLHLTIMTTKHFLMGKEIDFYHREEHKKIKNFDSIWKDKFVEEYNVKELKKLAIERFNEIVKIKKISETVQANALKEIDLYWDGITNLKEALYSSK